MQEVKIKIRGEQNAPDSSLEVVSVGQMFEENGFLCLVYDEVVGEEENGVVHVEKNVIRVNDEQVEVIKNGTANSHMVFVPDQTTYTYYTTPVGKMEIGVFTDEIERFYNEEGFSLNLRYQLEMNQTFVSDNSVNIAVHF